ncbi:hypothetical protein FO519_009177 [Halicephalobus sp. NKZ332]|nr:hypothetical protein FO519_009177 [Halicephalobus sp. NKZ332]
MNSDENSKGSTDDSGIVLSTSILSQVSLESKNLPTRKRSMVDEDESNDENESNPETTSRKEKSLGKLCKRFLTAMDEESKTGTDVHLETVARKMSVEKRRIYDIVNVMEALEAMSKTNKSFYKWKGLTRLPILMHELSEESKLEQLPTKVNQVNQAMCSFTELAPVSQQETVGSLVGEASSSSLKPLSHSDSFKSNGQRDRNGKNSLAQLCRRFLMVLLCNPKDKRRVSLDVASTVLIKDPESEGFDPPSRSRCRRLYDIANVLVAMGLIKKVHYLFGTKKIPLFEYCGPEPEGMDALKVHFTNPELAERNMKEFFASAGLNDVCPPAKLRRISSEKIPTPNIKILGERNSQNLSFQRSVTLSDLQNVQNFYNQAKKNPIAQLAQLARQQLEDSPENKENIPPISTFGSQADFAKPVPRPIQRTPLGPLPPLNFNLWGVENLDFSQKPQNHQNYSNLYSVNSLLNKKTPVKSAVTMPHQVTDSPKAFRPVTSTGFSDMNIHVAAAYLTSICNG